MDKQDGLAYSTPKQEIEFSNLVNHLPVGVCKFLMDDKDTLVYGNQCFYDILGYTPEQMRDELGNGLSSTHFAQERGTVRDELGSALRSGSSGFRVEHRIVRRDGGTPWVLVSGNFTTHNGVPSAYCVVVDISDRKQMEERLRIDEERFRLALAQTENSIFDYDIANRVMTHAYKSAELYGLASVTHDVPDSLVAGNVVHPESVEVYLEMYNKIRSGALTATCVIRAKMTSEQYAWRKITMTNIFDQDGNAVRAVGMLEDIDEQTRREEYLLERSQRDALTGLYNKDTTESKIRKLLENKASSGVLLIIDIDLFKDVNDRYGHLFGDLVLAESAHRFVGLCRQQDVIGRIGGDEFMLYLDGVFTESVVLGKAEEICASFRTKFLHNGSSADVTCTVGLALCPSDGSSFEILYQKADVALYAAKRLGKNNWSLYDSAMNDNMEWVPYSSTEIDAPVVAL